jgi:hypothetical protein
MAPLQYERLVDPLEQLAEHGCLIDTPKVRENGTQGLQPVGGKHRRPKHTLTTHTHLETHTGY